MTRNSGENDSSISDGYWYNCRGGDIAASRLSGVVSGVPLWCKYNYKGPGDFTQSIEELGGQFRKGTRPSIYEHSTNNAHSILLAKL